MPTPSIQTKVTVNDFVQAAEQLQNSDLENLARRLLQIHARRKALNLPEREAQLLQGIVRTATYEGQERYRQLNGELKLRSLTEVELSELHELNELIGLSEAKTAERLSFLLELSQLRNVSLTVLMKQLQIMAPAVV